MNLHPTQRKLNLLPNKITTPNSTEYREVRTRPPSDFNFGKIIGAGSFGTVYLTQDVLTNEELAVKVLSIPTIIKGNKIKHVLREVEALRILNNCSKYFVHLNSISRVPKIFYIALSYAKNGELLKYLKSHKIFNIDCTRYYSAQLVLALEHLHSRKIVHGDLKPGHILIDHNFQILIIGFSRAKIQRDGQNQTNGDSEHSPSFQMDSFVGTAQFVSPEVLQNTKTTYSTDLWALGCLAFQMASGRFAFRGRSKHTIFRNILRPEYSFPNNFDEGLKDFIKKLLVLEPTERLGATDEVLYSSLRRHSIFDAVNWDDLGPLPKPSGSKIIQNRNDNVAGTSDHKKRGLQSTKASKQAIDNIPSQITRQKRKKSKTKKKNK